MKVPKELLSEMLFKYMELLPGSGGKIYQCDQILGLPEENSWEMTRERIDAMTEQELLTACEKIFM